MKIIKISNRIYPDTGGMAKQAYIYSRYYSKQKHQTECITCKQRSRPTVKNEIINEYLKIKYLPVYAPGINSHFLTLISFFIHFLIHGLRHIIQLISGNKEVIIHAHSPPPSSVLAYITFKLFRIPYIYSIHGIDTRIKSLLKRDLSIIAKNAKKVITVSRQLKRYLVDIYHLDNVCWIPNGIRSEDFYHVTNEKEKEMIIQELNLDSFLKIDDFIITYVGHMIYMQKVRGMIDFLLGFNNFLGRIPKLEPEKIKLLFIGGGDFSYLLRNKIKELKLEKEVFQLGIIREINSVYAISDLNALTSYTEGFPNSVLEAMASKTPCIISNTGENK